MTSGRQALYWGAGLCVFVLLLYVLRDVMLPFVAGMAVAYFLDPVVDRLETWKMSRTFATSLVTVAFFALLIVAVILIAPILQSQLFGFINSLPDYISKLREFIGPLLDQFALGAVGGSGGDQVAGVAFKAADIVGRLLKGLWSGGLALINLVSLIFITPVVSFYLLRDWDRLVARIDGLLPRQHAQVVRRLMADIDRSLAAFVRGTGTVCLALAVLYALALTLVGLQFGLVVGLGAGLISFVPFVGAVTGLIVSTALAVIQFWPDYLHVVLVVAVFAVGQVLEGNFLTPRLVGSRVGLHPLWLIFALLAGGALFGFVGILIAVPSAAAIGVLVRFAMERYLASSLYLGGEGADGGGDDGAAGAT